MGCGSSSSGNVHASQGVVVGGQPTRAPSGSRAVSNTNTPSLVVVAGANGNGNGNGNTAANGGLGSAPQVSPSSVANPTPPSGTTPVAAAGAPSSALGAPTIAAAATTPPTTSGASSPKSATVAPLPSSSVTPNGGLASTTVTATPSITSPGGTIRPRGSLSLSTVNPKGSGDGNNTPTGGLHSFMASGSGNGTQSVSGAHGKLSTLVIVDEHGGVRRTSAAAVASQSRPVTADQKLNSWIANRQGSSDRLGESPVPGGGHNSTTARRSITGTNGSSPSIGHRAFGRPGSLELPDGMMLPPSLGRVASLDVPKTPPHMAMSASRIPPPSSLTLSLSNSNNPSESPTGAYGQSLTPGGRVRALEGGAQTLKPNTGSFRSRTLTTRQSGKPSTIVSALGARSSSTATNGDEKDGGEAKDIDRSGTISAAEMMDQLRRVEKGFTHPSPSSHENHDPNLSNSNNTLSPTNGSGHDDMGRSLTIDVTAPERPGGHNGGTINGLQLGSLSPVPSPTPRSGEANALRKRLIYQKAFAKYDVNNNGRMENAELRNLLNDLQWDSDDEQVARAIQALDRDGNGYIELDEFLNWSRYAWEHFIHRTSTRNTAAAAAARDLVDSGIQSPFTKQRRKWGAPMANSSGNGGSSPLGGLTMSGGAATTIRSPSPMNRDLTNSNNSLTTSGGGLTNSTGSNTNGALPPTSIATGLTINTNERHATLRGSLRSPIPSLVAVTELPDEHRGSISLAQARRLSTGTAIM